MKAPRHLLSAVIAVLALVVSGQSAPAATPVLFDTDIGTDIDDAYALGLILRSPELQLVGVTTVSGDAVARARLAAKLLAADGRTDVPVYAGTSTAPQYMRQTDWAAGYTAPNLHLDGGVDYLREQIDRRPGELTIIAVGELTNVAALLAAEPGIAAKIKAIALMGGSVRQGYAPGSAPEAEWNIKSNAAAARAVFASGVPLLVAPLDSTSRLRLEPEWRVRIFGAGTPFNDAVAALDYLWQNTNTWKGAVPVLYDPLAVALVASPDLVDLTALHVEVDAAGMTKETAGAPNARIALTADPARFLEYFTARLAGSAKH